MVYGLYINERMKDLIVFTEVDVERLNLSGFPKWIFKGEDLIVNYVVRDYQVKILTDTGLTYTLDLSIG